MGLLTFPVFSPSQTENFLRCPRMWDWSKRWTSIEVWSPERTIGHAVDAGVCTWLSSVYSDETGYAAAEMYLDSDWPDDAPFEMTKDSAWNLVKKVLKVVFVKLRDELGDAKVIAVHPRLGPENCEPDVILTREHGWIEVLDLKYTHSIQPQYVGDRLRQFEPSGQLRHYAWRACEKYEARCRQVGVAFMTGTPRTDVKTAWFDVTPEYMERWLEGRKQVWRQMDMIKRGLIPLWDSEGNCFKYGLNHACPFYDGHFRLNGDEEHFSRIYNPRNQ